MPFKLSPITTKTALSVNKKGGLALNPYQGCVFACEFCSAIKMNYFTGRTIEKWDKTGWGGWVDYKTNLIDLLKKEHKKIGKSKVYFGNATDIYMPIEKELALIPPILEYFLENPPLELEVQTRGAAKDIVRDIPLLQELAKITKVRISYSIHTDRDDVKKIFEPKAPSLKSRRDGLKLYYEAGLKTRISCMPLLPLDPENYAKMYGSYVSEYVWVAPMYHQHLTYDLFKNNFPDWLEPRFLTKRMEEIKSAFAEIGIKAFIRS
ncbi:MAG: radical SAM protein [Candidatus Sericytochromatia bacterium]|nr:radical SAM protein [Candidatus Sericytochromatia bacterium]